MKPATAAKKLSIHLQAAPAEFQEGVVSRDQLRALQTDPPQWLRDLRADGPHPRQVSAARLGVSIAGLARSGVTEALTTEQIDELNADPPQWLRRERDTQAETRKEAERVQELHKQQELDRQQAESSDRAERVRGDARSSSSSRNPRASAPRGKR
jgi:hypothetical protein